MQQADNTNRVLQAFYDAMARLGRYEWRILLVVALIIGGLWLALTVTEEVVEGDTHEIDRQLLLALREPDDASDPLGPVWLEEMIRDFTALGGTGFLVLLVTAATAYLFMLGRYPDMWVLLIAVIGGAVLSFFLKDVFDRPRPDLVPIEIFYYSASFPSGHALIAATTYLTLAGLLAQIQPRFRLKAYILLLALFVMILVGFSRVYLGVHWPSDVLAGWTIGAVWALLCWLGARWWRGRQTAASQAEQL